MLQQGRQDQATGSDDVLRGQALKSHALEMIAQGQEKQKAGRIIRDKGHAYVSISNGN